MIRTTKSYLFIYFYLLNKNIDFVPLPFFHIISWNLRLPQSQNELALWGYGGFAPQAWMTCNESSQRQAVYELQLAKTGADN